MAKKQARHETTAVAEPAQARKLPTFGEALVDAIERLTAYRRVEAQLFDTGDARARNDAETARTELIASADAAVAALKRDMA